MSAKESKLNALTKSWNEAKSNENGWREIRRQAEAEILELYKDEVAGLKAGLESTNKLTSTLKLGELEVTLGRELKVHQPAAVEFLTHHPAFVGVIFRPEYKADSRAVLNAIAQGNGLAQELKMVVSFADRSPSFSAKG